MKDVNRRILNYRKMANLTQTDMAEKLDIKCSTYSQMERKGLITVDRLFEMSKIFGVSPCQLYLGKEPCRDEAISSLQAAQPSILKQPEIEKPKKEIFIVTKKEENMLKIIRNLSKSNYNKIMDLVGELYKEEKEK